MRTFTPAATDVKRITNSYITMWLCGFSSFDYSCNSYKITCKAKPDCSPPGGYPPHRLLIINRWANWFVSRRTRVSGKCPRGELCEGKCPFQSRGNVCFPVYWCCQQKLSSVDVVYYTYDGRARRGWMHERPSKSFETSYLIVNKMVKINGWVRISKY